MLHRWLTNVAVSIRPYFLEDSGTELSIFTHLVPMALTQIIAYLRFNIMCV